MSVIAEAHPRITLPWLNNCLSAHRGSSAITDHAIEDVGTGSGFAGTVLRVSLTYDPPCDAPANVIVKLPVKAGDIMNMLKSQDMLLRESHFYRDMAPGLGLRTPHIYHVEIDGEDFAIVMEDLGDIKPPDTMEMVDIDEAKNALVAIAELHAAFWNSPEVESAWLAPIAPSSPEIRNQLDNGLTSTINIMEASDIDVDYALACARTLKKVLPKFPDQIPMLKPITVIHGDFHRNNLHIDGGNVTIYDWQAVMKGVPLSDVANFLITGLDASALNETRDELLRAYHVSLQKNGISDYSLKQVKRAYDQAATDIVIKLLVVIGTVDLDVEGGDELAETILSRIDSHARNVNAIWKLRFLPLVFLVIRIINFFARPSRI